MSSPLVGLFRLGVACLAWVLACASSSPPERSVLVKHSDRAMVILPLNLTRPLGSELEAAREIVGAEIERYLKRHPRPLKRLPYAAARGLWVDSVREARESGRAEAGYDDAVRLLIERIAQSANFEYLAIPTLFQQRAEFAGRRALWDGVERSLEMDPADATEDEPLVQGAAPAASLHVAIFDASGARVQEAQSGLVLLARLEPNPRPSARNPAPYALADHPSPFSDRELLWDGIARAFAPFLEADLPPSRGTRRR